MKRGLHWLINAATSFTITEWYELKICFSALFDYEKNENIFQINKKKIIKRVAFKTYLFQIFCFKY